MALTPLGYAYKAIIAYHAYSSHSAHAILNLWSKSGRLLLLQIQ